MLQPVNKLPQEILSRVAQDVPGHLDKDTRKIVPLTHVCRYWRESIVSGPECWSMSMISSHSEFLAALSPDRPSWKLERSKAFPLEITLNMAETRRRPGFSDLLKPYIQNTESLTLSTLRTPGYLVQTVPDFP